MSAHQATFPIKTMARVFGVSASGDSSLARQTRFGASDDRSGRGAQDPHDPRRLARNLWRAAHPCRVQGGRRGHRQEAGRPPDAGGRARRRQPAQKRDDDTARSRAPTGQRSRASQIPRFARPFGSSRRSRTSCGWPTSPSCPRSRATFSWPSCSMPGCESACNFDPLSRGIGAQN